MTMGVASRELVVMRDGTVATRRALQLLWALEDAGLTVTAPAGRLSVEPAHRLPEAVRLEIAAHRDDLVRLVTLCEQTEAPA